MAATYTLQQLADITQSILQGDGAIQIQRVASLEKASTGDIGYIRDAKYKQYLPQIKASALILPPDLAKDYQGNCLINADPYLAYAKAVSVLNPIPQPALGIHPSAVVADSVVMGAGCSIAANVVLGERVVLGQGVMVAAGCVIEADCVIGEATLIYPNVSIGRDTQIGKRCVIQAGAAIGGDGFGFAPDKGTWFKIPQIGNVILEDDVEVGANTTIDRASMGSTRVGKGTKLDNLIQVAHNVQIGQYTVIAGSTGIAGSAKIGNHCRIGGMCGISGHIEIVDNVTITGRTFVASSIAEAGTYSSDTTAEPSSSWRRNVTRFHQLDKLFKRVADLEKQLAALNNKDSH
jgi:UDP-3-O-[3-hydroxymyristoyl] glucosamine N-acyltransferase